MSSRGYQFKLIHEKAASEDRLKHGTHEKVAEAIYNLISAERKGQQLV